MKNLIVIALLSTMLVGCGGGGATVQSSSATRGQELIDLKKALDEGIITQDEFEEAKENIIERE